MSSPARVPRWSVTSQIEQVQATPGGQLVDGYTVSFVTAQGHQGTVFIPRTSYNRDTVTREVDTQARLLDAVGALTSED